MKFSLFPFLQYLKYFLKKEDKHSLHSPFVYGLYTGLTKYLSENISSFPVIEQMRQELLKDQTIVSINDLGAGSRYFSSPSRKISDVAKYSSSSRKHSLLYQYFCSLTPAQTVVELGTGLGLNSCYLAEATKGKLFTFEGAEALLERTKENLKVYDNIEVVAGDITETLPGFLENEPKIDFAMLDANHTYEHTISYYRQLKAHIHETSVLIIGDIHWSEGMNRAWKEIIKAENIRLSLDFYECGVLLFKTGLEKEDYILDF
ncbi:MAG TPA: class I SAM-dependent methyltransferase [Cyclobacteriaceae bacterium]|nr:class I SAM-dependent methyltransferase [Cyclobacteriaceae bacterium]